MDYNILLLFGRLSAKSSFYPNDVHLAQFWQAMLLLSLLSLILTHEDHTQNRLHWGGEEEGSDSHSFWQLL